jgi:GH15 family glucan-1,4-alpha-glucosidase
VGKLFDQAVPPSALEARQLGDETVMFWRRWLAQCSYRGRWREIVHRSALTLKHSRLMSWVAIDRAIRIAGRRGLSGDLVRWTDTRNAIFAWIWSPTASSIATTPPHRPTASTALKAPSRCAASGMSSDHARGIRG